MKPFQQSLEHLSSVMLKRVTEHERRFTEKVHPPEIIQKLLKQFRLISNQLGIIQRATLKNIILQRPKTKTMNRINRSCIKITKCPFKNLFNPAQTSDA